MSEALIGLNRVQINKQKLLEKLKQNREKHKVEYEEALSGWKQDVIAEMEKNLVLAKANEFHLHIHLEKPTDHSEDYDHVISLLSASEDEIVIISASEFRQYHEDQWRWRGGHEEAVMNYSKAHLR
jgi:hypothetical protein